MMKKSLAMIMTISLILSFAVIPAHAATFSSSNWAQYEAGFYTSTDDFKETNKVTKTTSFGSDQITAVRMVAASTKTLTADRNPVAYKFGEDSSDYGTYASNNAAYAHMRVYLASFSDANRTAFNMIQLRMDKNGTGESRDGFKFDRDGQNYFYATNYGSSAAYTSKDWLNVFHQGRDGVGPASSATANSDTLTLSDSNYDKVDIIVEYNKQGGATTYVFGNGKFLANYYDSVITDKHFHGIVFRVNKGKSIRSNSDYIAVKFDSDRIGHREYYNTENYYVTMEDVLQDAGLGADSIDSTMMYKTKSGDLQWYMPGNEQTAFTYETGYSERKRINENVTYSGTEATIAVTNTDSENYALAAKMLSGFYPVIGKMGVSYESYHPRAKYIKLSFDQTISASAMWLEYQIYYSDGVRALQMWNNEGNLVVGIKGGVNKTCDGIGGNPIATTTGKNHIDWILEPDEDNGRVNEYVYVNNKLAGKGYFEKTVRINDIRLNTKSAAGTVKIDNWSMTLYNENAEYYMNIDYPITGNVPWPAQITGTDYEAGTGENAGKIALSATISNKVGSIAENSKFYVAVYDSLHTLLDVKVIDYQDGFSFGDCYEQTYDEETSAYAKFFIWSPGFEPQAKFEEISLSLE